MTSRRRSRSDLGARVFDEPLAIERGALSRILPVAELSPSELAAFFPGSPMAGPALEDRIGVIRIRGSFYRGFFWDDYTDIREIIDEAVADSTVSGIILDIDSPGGAVAGCFDLVDHIAGLRDEKPIWALANDQATSAAYAIASAASQVFTTRTGHLGSIGVLALHLDRSEYERQQGFKYTEVASGARKADLSPHTPLSTRARSDLQARVSAAAEMFFEIVASNRGLTVDAIRDQEAAVFLGQRAVDEGLAEGIATLDELVERMRTEIQEAGSPPSSTAAGASAASQGGAGMSGTTTEQPGKPGNENPNPEPAAEPAGGNVVNLEEARTQARGEGESAARQAAQARATEINDLCALAGCPERAGAFIASDTSIDDIKAKLLESRAANAGPEVNNQNANPSADDPKVKTLMEDNMRGLLAERGMGKGA